MLERLERLATDPILGLMGLYRADTDPRKVDLGVGVYRNDLGETPILGAVRRAEQVVLGRQATKSYVAPVGNAGFNLAMAKLVLGEDRKSTRLNSSHQIISYAVFCLKKTNPLHARGDTIT